MSKIRWLDRVRDDNKVRTVGGGGVYYSATSEVYLSTSPLVRSLVKIAAV